MIIVFGSINLDLIGKVSRIPKPGETVPGTSFASAPGGKGANQALAARRAGAQVRMVGAAGNDSYATEALSLLDTDEVDLSGVKRTDGATGIAMIFVDDAGENVIGILPGANGLVTEADADAAIATMSSTDILVVQQEVPVAATVRALELARARGIITILNTAPFLPSTPETAKLALIVVANETEFELLSGSAPTEAVVAEWAKTHGQSLVVTLGSKGAWGASPNAFWRADALKVTPVDTVGAGDTFVGYLAAGIDAGHDMETSMGRAAIAASLACLIAGAQPSIPFDEDVERALTAPAPY